MTARFIDAQVRRYIAVSGFDNAADAFDLQHLERVRLEFEKFEIPANDPHE